VVVAASVPIAVAVNGLRVAVTGIACEIWGRAAAADPWHSLTGWVTFAGSLLLLVLILRWLETTRRQSDQLTPALV
jgi:exosortase/archaeosortase family protein